MMPLFAVISSHHLMLLVFNVGLFVKYVFIKVILVQMSIFIFKFRLVVNLLFGYDYSITICILLIDIFEPILLYNVLQIFNILLQNVGVILVLILLLNRHAWRDFASSSGCFRYWHLSTSTVANSDCMCTLALVIWVQTCTKSTIQVSFA